MIETVICLNGHEVVSSKVPDDWDPDSVVASVFIGIPNLGYWSPEALENLYKGVLQTVKEYTTFIRPFLKGSARAKVTKFLNQVDRKIKASHTYVDKVQYKELFLRLIYEDVLRAEGLSTLRGFGLANRFGDHLRGNPEKQSIVEVY